MRQILLTTVTTVLLACCTHADTIVDTLPANNQANLAADSAQTFTTGTLGSADRLDTIEIEGPQADNGEFLGPFTLELYTDTDGDHSTWDPAALVASSTEGTFVSGGATITTFSFNSQPVLSDNTVYGFLYTDGAGAAIGSRNGLTNDNAISDGTLFSGGGQVFGDAFDTAMRITTIPEPSTLSLLALAGLVLLRLRRK